MQVAICVGSDSDLPVMAACADTLNELGISFEVHVLSAHRTPHRMLEFAGAASGLGFKVVIAAAGGAAHLPGMIASATILPVIGVPVPSTPLMGVDALLSIVQMPSGVPVATVAIGQAANAAILAAQILALGDAALDARLRARRAETARRVAQISQRVTEEYANRARS